MGEKSPEYEGKFGEMQTEFSKNEYNYIFIKKNRNLYHTVFEISIAVRS